VVLTEAGRVFLPHAEAVLAAARDGAEAVRGLTSAESGAVSLALVGTLAATGVVGRLRGFARRHPGARRELRTANSREVSGLVRRGEVVLGLRYFDDPSPALVSRQVAEEVMVLACPAEHRFAGKRLRDPALLAGERWVGFPTAPGRHDSFAHLLARQLAAAGLDGAEVVEIDSLTAQKRLIEAGFGIGLLPESSVQEELRLGTLALIRAPRLRCAVPVFLLQRKRGYLSAAAQALIALIGGAPLRPRSGVAARRGRGLGAPRRRRPGDIARGAGEDGPGGLRPARPGRSARAPL
jgi:DNA-binding transcriptional LysR family regulator